MLPINPSGLSQNFMDVLKSFYKVFVGNIGFGSPTSYDANGVGTVFASDNTNGVLVRVGSLSNPSSLPSFWGGNNTATAITHNLNRVPVGFIVVSKTLTCDVYNASPFAATKTTITLYTTADTADTLLYIF